MYVCWSLLLVGKVFFAIESPFVQVFQAASRREYWSDV